MQVRNLEAMTFAFVTFIGVLLTVDPGSELHGQQFGSGHRAEVRGGYWAEAHVPRMIRRELRGRTVIIPPGISVYPGPFPGEAYRFGYGYGSGFGYDPYERGSFRAPDLFDDPFFRMQQKPAFPNRSRGKQNRFRD